MTYGVRIAREGSDLERRPGHDLWRVDLVLELVLAQLRAHEAERQLGAVDRHVRKVAQDVGQRAHVVLMRVREEDAAHLRLVVLQVGDVGDDEVDAEHLLVGEHQAGVDDDHVVALLDGHHVLADLANTAERDHAKRVSH